MNTKRWNLNSVFCSSEQTFSISNIPSTYKPQLFGFFAKNDFLTVHGIRTDDIFSYQLNFPMKDIFFVYLTYNKSVLDFISANVTSNNHKYAFLSYKRGKYYDPDSYTFRCQHCCVQGNKIIIQAPNSTLNRQIPGFMSISDPATMIEWQISSQPINEAEEEQRLTFLWNIHELEILAFFNRNQNIFSHYS